MAMRLLLQISLTVGASAGMAQSHLETALAKEVLARAQAASISENREYCGYLGYGEDGQLVSTDATRGQRDECITDWPDDIDVVASWHTHAGFDDGALSEVPSARDMEADEEEGIDGYVATPGGRLWYVDTTDMVTSQLCGLGCIRSDPAFVTGVEGEIATSYTYQELLQREAFE